MDNNDINDNIGIFDPEGKNNNPLNGKPYSEEYKRLALFWSNLPVYKLAKDISRDIKENQVLLCISGTGSGKSVIIPKLALHILNYKGKIGMTLPKQIITKSAAEFGALTLDVKIGEEIGYQYKGSDKKMKSEKTKLLYVTDGTIVSILLKDPYLYEYQIMILDEAHERKVQIDFLLYLLRNTLRLRPDFKIIIMSATINSEIFANYFSEFSFKKINVEGERLFPIESIFLEKSLAYENIIKEGFDILINILKNDKIINKDSSHDSIFFVTSSNESFSLCKKLNDYLEKDKSINCKITCKGDVFCIEVFANMDPNKQILAQDKDLYKLNTNFNRKVVIATNVAESSLTIDGIKYVIDSGHELSGSFDPSYRARRLDRILISSAQAKQRMGRAGRTSPGVCYHMYTEDEFKNKMKKFPEPDIRTSDITHESLKLINIPNINTISNLLETLSNFIEPPKEDYIKVALNNLIQLGLIENDIVSEIGKVVSNIPENNIMISISILYGKKFKCSKEVMKIASMIDSCKSNLNELYKLPHSLTEFTHDQNNISQKIKSDLRAKFNNSRNKSLSKYGDHMSLLKMFDEFDDKRRKYPNDDQKINKWAYENFLKISTLRKAVNHYKKIRYQIDKINISSISELSDENIKNYLEISSLNLEDRILCCLIIGFRLNTAIQTNNKEYYKTQYSKDLKIKISRMSFLNLKKTQSKNIFYNELFISLGKADLNIVSIIPNNIIKLLS